MGGDDAVSRPLRQHRLDEQHVSALASGGGDVNTIAELLTVERSWRLLQLRALLDIVGPDHDTGPLPSVRDAWTCSSKPNDTTRPRSTTCCCTPRRVPGRLTRCGVSAAPPAPRCRSGSTSAICIPSPPRQPCLPASISG